MSFEKEYKKELVEDVVNECQVSSYDYLEFMLDCVRTVVSEWPDAELARWLGYENEPTCDVQDSIECYDGTCQHINDE